VYPISFNIVARKTPADLLVSKTIWRRTNVDAQATTPAGMPSFHGVSSLYDLHPIPLGPKKSFAKA
jgi:hypothetical protein